MKLFTTASALSFAAVSIARTVTVYNHCTFTVWPAIFTDPNFANTAPSQTTGWQANPETSVTFQVADNWTAGRIWGRRECKFDGSGLPTTCKVGGCNGGLVCDKKTGTGVPPVTLAEFTLGANGQDNYDVSLVDGFNVPMRITNNKDCPVVGCPAKLNLSCPSELVGPRDSNGGVIGCKSDCLANPSNSAACCTGSHSTPGTCPSSGVPHYNFFKSNCPNAYAYAYDDRTALKTCAASKLTSYTVTFCPDP